MEYKVNDTVMYGAQGVCRIVDISEREFAGNTMTYYILKPVYDEKSTIFVPVKNEKLTEKLRRILSAEEIHTLIKSMPEEKTLWIEEENVRKERYKEILTHGDRTQLIGMLKALDVHRKELEEKGKKLHIADDTFFKEAEKMLYEEFALALDLQLEEVLPFILEQIEVKAKAPEKRQEVSES